MRVRHVGTTLAEQSQYAMSCVECGIVQFDDSPAKCLRFRNFVFDGPQAKIAYRRESPRITSDRRRQKESVIKVDIDRVL
jgi:hypothetical protein